MMQDVPIFWANGPMKSERTATTGPQLSFGRRQLTKHIDSDTREDESTGVVRQSQVIPPPTRGLAMSNDSKGEILHHFVD
jgi:hypothetical protein